MRNLIWGIVLLLGITVGSCGTVKTEYVPVVSTHTEYVDRVKTDSIYDRDSIFMMVKGDTVYKEKFKFKYRYIYKVDSIKHTDLIRVPYPVEKKVEVKKPLNWYERTCVWGFPILLLLVGLRLYAKLKFKI